MNCVSCDPPHAVRTDKVAAHAAPAAGTGIAPCVDGVAPSRLKPLLQGSARDPALPV